MVSEGGGAVGEAASTSAQPETASSARNTASGWYGVESDTTVRGWCRDRAQTDRRLLVEVAVDGEAIATVVADRFNDRLAESGQGDGRFSFVCAIPARFRDGVPHESSARIASDGFHAKGLKTKRAEFLLASTAPMPSVALRRIGPDGVHGTLTGVALREELDVWLDGRRLEETDYQVEWRFGDRSTLPFLLRLTGEDPLALVARDLIVAYPGVREIGGGTALATLLEIGVSPLGEGRYRLALGPGVAWPSERPLDAEIRVAADDAPLATLALALTRNVAEFTLPDWPGSETLRLRPMLAGVPIAPDIVFRQTAMPRRLLPNGSFARWDAHGPADFTVPDGVIPERGFHAFPPRLKDQHRLSGVLVGVAVAGGAVTCLLARPLVRFGVAGRGIDLGLGFLARASRPARIVLRIVSGDRTIVASIDAAIGLRWKDEHRSTRIDGGLTAAGGTRFELLVEPLGAEADPVFVEIAGLHCGDPLLRDFADAPAPPAPRGVPAPGANLVVNADLAHWPGGLARDVRGGGVELAEGWRIARADGDGQARAMALPAPDDLPGQYAIGLALPAVTGPVRLEATLDAAMLFGHGIVRFRARRLDTGRSEPGQPWDFIDRVSIVRRRARPGDEAAGTATELAMAGRRLVLDRDWRDYTLTFTIAAAEEAGFDLSDLADDVIDHVVAFEFRQPVGVAIAGLTVALGPEDQSAPPPPIAFEDGNIASQLGALRGLEGWRGPVALRPSPAGAPSAADAADPLRWSWSHAASGTVEVAICVHDAADETLACLASLVGASAVPHTVRIVDDGSGEDTRRRLIAFVADKPWMTLVGNERNLGYTASANRAIKGSAADWVVLLNSDTVVPRGWIEGLLEVAASDARTAMVGPVSNAATYQSVPDLYDGTGKWAVNPLPAGYTPAGMAALVADRSQRRFPRVPLLNGFCTLIRRGAFLEVGGLDEQAFPMGYGEENDLCLRMGKAGWRLRVADHVYVHHLKSASFGNARRTELAKAGDRALRALHPDVDIGALGRDFLATPALAELRAAVKAAYPAPAVPIQEGEG